MRSLVPLQRFDGLTLAPPYRPDEGASEPLLERPGDPERCVQPASPDDLQRCSDGGTRLSFVWEAASMPHPARS